MPGDHVIDGRSILSLFTDPPDTWDSELLYEYYWEHAFPHTPTVFALRDDRYKYIYYHGIWDRMEFYDLQADPRERVNLIDVPALQQEIRARRDRLWELLQSTGGMQIPLKVPPYFQANERLQD